MQLYQVTLRGPSEAIFDHLLSRINEPLDRNLVALFRRHVAGVHAADAYAVKLTRDAELHIDDELPGDLQEKVREALSRRKTGIPSRLLYDPHLPEACLDLLRRRLALYPESLIPGWRYHNFSDFLDFANPGVEGDSQERGTGFQPVSDFTPRTAKVERRRRKK